MVTVDALRQGRECFERQAWRDAHARLSEANSEAALEPEDIDRLAKCAFMLGRESESADLWERAHHEFQNRGNAEQAAGCAFRIGFDLLLKGQTAQGSGWLARARRLLDDAQQDSVVRGFLLTPEAIGSIRRGDPARAYELFSEALAIGRRFHDSDLTTFARLGQGRALIRMGRPAEGVPLLDEAMVAITAGEMSPLHVADMYCSVIDACAEIFDLRRAHEWTEALSRWCERQADEYPYRGVCLIHRAEILKIHGLWSDAMGEAERAREQLVVPPPKPAAGGAYYQCGELHRLRGEFEKAEASYRQASEFGRRPQPGLALLRLAQGDTDAALASMRRVVDEARDPSMRARVLGAYVEILLAAGDTDTARAAANELREIAGTIGAPFLLAMSLHCTGAVLVAAGDADGALSTVREALDLWREIEAPYEEARSRELMAIASRLVGDDDTAHLELDAARRVFQRLGAVTDAARVAALVRRGAPAEAGRQLTSRELEVLGLVATGKTNRAIADALRLSEKTVARHISNIFTKLGLSTRAAATAYAYRNRLV